MPDWEASGRLPVTSCTAEHAVHLISGPIRLRVVLLLPTTRHCKAMEMLCLVRFVAMSDDQFIAWEAVEHFGAALEYCSGREIHREDLQAMTVFSDVDAALDLLEDTLQAGETEGFAISASLAQGIQSKATLASSLCGFTEGSIETLFQLSSAATLQEVAISGKLSSIIKLAAPRHAARFRPIKPPANAKIRSVLVMTPRSGSDPLENLV